MYIQTFTKIVPIKQQVIHDRLKYPKSSSNSRLLVRHKQSGILIMALGC